jgi:arginase
MLSYMSVGNNTLSQKQIFQIRQQQYSSPDLDLIEAPWGFGGTDNLAQEGAHAFLGNQELVKKLTAIGSVAREIHPPSLGPFEVEEEPQKIRNLTAILTVNNWLADTVKHSLAEGHIPIVFGGDGSLSIASVSALVEFYGTSARDDIGIIWISNHFCNSSPRVTKSWNANRMTFTALTFTGEAKHPDFIKLMNFRNLPAPIFNKQNVVHFAINHKSAQEAEEHRFFTMEEIEEIGVTEAINQAIDALEHCKHLHLIWDVNSLDLGGVSNYSLGQLRYREALSIARIIDVRIRRQNKLRSIDIVEHCPSREAWDKKGETAEWITDILCNIFGENIFNAARKY